MLSNCNHASLMKGMVPYNQILSSNLDAELQVAEVAIATSTIPEQGVSHRS